mmetsp:Transcript_76647/g.173368  ORF Transcript_76647/g.173368 Transcript_76647/m.173368 type:complete len:183 (+) Transcript_76647:41-589(+)
MGFTPELGTGTTQRASPSPAVTRCLLAMTKEEAALLGSHTAKTGAGMLEPYNLRRTVGTVKYIAPRVSPAVAGRRSTAMSPNGSLADGFGFQASDHFGSLLQRAASAPSLGLAGVASHASSSRATTPKSHSTRAGMSASLKAVASVEMSEMKHNVPAGVVQSLLNPSIPFSGFPSLSYLRGS